jgi:hypothetical protein
MRGFPKFMNTPQDLENCKKMFPEETKTKLASWVNDSKPVEVTDEKTGVRTSVTNISPHLAKVGLTVETASLVIADVQADEIITP